MPELNELLAYRHPRVVASYRRQYPHNEQMADDLFVEMLKYLWLSSKHAMDRVLNPRDESLQFMFVMHEEMRDIDNMWHTFILYTQDYTEFCRRYFGEYLHHQPDVADTHPQAPPEFETDLEKYLSYVYDNLGEATTRRWFAMHLEDQ